jgi:DNA-binding SARP family transcriptional activator
VSPTAQGTAPDSPTVATAPGLASNASELSTSDDGPPIRISLLGAFELHSPTGTRIKRTATRDLMAYLALHPHGATRDELLEALWPDGDPRRTRPRLWQSITEARKHLGDLLLRKGERYALDRNLVSV